MSPRRRRFNPASGADERKGENRSAAAFVVSDSVRLLLATLLALSLPLAAGCGGGDNGGAQGGGGGGGGASGGGQTIQVAALDFHFHPADLEVNPGAVSIELRNDGQAPHAIEVEGNGVEKESATIGPGESTTLDLDLDQGTYEIYCPVDGHKARGMVGTLTVGSGGGAATTEDEENTTTGTDETGTENEDGSGSGGGSGY